ncbi:MAG TPA: SIR2 family protein [Flavobacteriales bacterium]|nr:SIR2 family protein [Flavobacteriales bacterium]
MTKRKPQSHLINIIKSTRDHHPNFVLMLGAGASATSGVKLARDMIKEWRIQYLKMNDATSLGETLLKQQPWYERPEEYSILFEDLYDEPSQRREFIESCIASATPSWGYIYLVNLLRKHVFNTVFTTNFDDLLNEACYSFSSDVRPILCAHDSSISSVRITSQRPKIIKLHGDFLFDNIKNTVRELETLEKNTQDKFKQYANEFGFVFIGYAGNDRSIMDTLNALLKFDGYFPHGIYWCIRKGAPICEKVDLLSRFPKFKLIEIDGFDQFFAELHSELDLRLQPEMSEPYDALVQRLNALVESINLHGDSISHPVIERDIKALGYNISQLSSRAKNQQGEAAESFDKPTTLIEHELPIPFGFLSSVSELEKDLAMAYKYRIKEIETQPTPSAFTEVFKLMFATGDYTHKSKLLEKLFSSKDLFLKSPGATWDVALTFISNADYENAEKILDWGYELSKRTKAPFNMEFYFLNKLQIKAHRELSFDEKETAALERMRQSENLMARWGALILLKRYAEAEDLITRLIKTTNTVPSGIRNWPITKLLLPHLGNPQLFDKL